MRKTFYLRHKGFFDRFNGLFLGNTVLERGLVLSPVVVASYNYKHSLILGIGFMLITFFSVLISSFVPKRGTYTVRSILYMLISCAVFVPVAMLLNSMYPEAALKLGVFLPLLVANSLIVVKSESRFHKRSKGHMILDLICHCVGFFIVIMLVGIFREFLGSGMLWGEPVEGMISVPAVLLPFSGFIIVGFFAAFVKMIRIRLENPKD